MKKSRGKGVAFIDTQELLNELSEVEKAAKHLGDGTRKK